MSKPRKEYVPLMRLLREIDKYGNKLHFTTPKRSYIAGKGVGHYFLVAYVEYSNLPEISEEFEDLRELALRMREIGNLSAWSRNQ